MPTGSGNRELSFARVISGRMEDSIQMIVRYAWSEVYMGREEVEEAKSQWKKERERQRHS